MLIINKETLTICLVVNIKRRKPEPITMVCQDHCTSIVPLLLKILLGMKIEIRVISVGHNLFLLSFFGLSRINFFQLFFKKKYFNMSNNSSTIKVCPKETNFYCVELLDILKIYIMILRRESWHQVLLVIISMVDKFASMVKLPLFFLKK